MPETRQIEAKIRLLKGFDLNHCQCGMEIMIRMEDLNDQNILDGYAENIRKYAPELPITFHAPFIHNNPKRIKDNFFMSQKGFGYLVKSYEFADRIKANLMNIHGHVLYNAPQANKGAGWIERKNNRAVKRVVEDITAVKDMFLFNVPISIETMPACVNWDWTVDPSGYLYDASTALPADLLEIANATDSSITLDSSHLLQDYDSSGVLGIAESFGDKIGHVHLNDADKTLGLPWLRKTKEGLPFGHGRMGMKAAKELIAYIVRCSRKRDIFIVPEVNHDYLKPAGLQKAVEELIERLRTAGASI